MKTLLLAGYRTDDCPGLSATADGDLLLDRRLGELEALGAEVIVVVSGAGAEALLRRSRRLAEFELVYDTNDDAVSLVTNVRAGLAAAGEDPCFVLPVEMACPPRPVWDALWGTGLTAGARVSYVQPARGFPLLLTRFGVSEVARLPDLKSLADTRLEPTPSAI